MVQIYVQVKELPQIEYSSGMKKKWNYTGLFYETASNLKSNSIQFEITKIELEYLYLCVSSSPYVFNYIQWANYIFDAVQYPIISCVPCYISFEQCLWYSHHKSGMSANYAHFESIMEDNGNFRAFRFSVLTFRSDFWNLLPRNNINIPQLTKRKCKCILEIILNKI